MGQTLQRHTSLPVQKAADSLEVAPNTVYFNSPDREVAIFNGKLHRMESRPGHPALILLAMEDVTDCDSSCKGQDHG